jgi:hypothetical protein
MVSPIAVYTFPYSPRPTLTVIPVIQGHPEHGFLVADAGGSGGTLMCVSPDVILQSHKRSANRCITRYTCEPELKFSIIAMLGTARKQIFYIDISVGS